MTTEPKAAAKKPRTGEIAKQAFEQYAGGLNVIRLRPDYQLHLKRNVVLGSVDPTLLHSQSGALVVLDAATIAVTLPAITTDDHIGTYFDFVTHTVATSHTITAGAADLLMGGVWMVDFDAVYTAPQGIFLEPDISDDLIMTMNGTTTGGKPGTEFRITAISLTRWFVQGTVAGDGVLATPFS